MSWQKCPVCDGTGITSPTIPGANTSETCRTCNGERIISEWNGRPPAKNTGEEKPEQDSDAVKMFRHFWSR